MVLVSICLQATYQSMQYLKEHTPLFLPRTNEDGEGERGLGGGQCHIKQSWYVRKGRSVALPKDLCRRVDQS